VCLLTLFFSIIFDFLIKWFDSFFVIKDTDLTKKNETSYDNHCDHALSCFPEFVSKKPNRSLINEKSFWE